MKLTHEFDELTPDKRPQDPTLDGSSLRFETMEHGASIPTRCPRRSA